MLSTAIYENLAHLNRSGQALATLRRDREAWDVLLESAGKCYVHGHEINWDRLVNPPRTPVSLPTYPWQRERYWLDGMANQTAGRFPQPFIGRGVESSIDPETWVWERAMSLDSHPILSDHIVLDRSIMPLAGQIEMLFETLEEAEAPVAFTDIELVNALMLPKSGAHLVQVVRKQDQYSISSRPESHDHGAAWLPNSRTVRTRVNRNPERIDLETIRSRCDRRTTGGRFYDLAADKGFQYGPEFRHIDELVHGEREALAILSSRDDGHRPYRLYPGVLDAGLQALLMLVTDEEPHLPVSVETLVLQRLPGQDEILYAYARMRETAPGGGLVADVYLVDEHGLPVVSLEGVTLSPPGGPGSHRITRNPHGLYREEWVAATPWEEQAPPSSVTHWYVLSDDKRLGTGLADVLSRHGGESECIDFFGDGPKNCPDALSDILGSLKPNNGIDVGIVRIWTGGGIGLTGRDTGPVLESFELIRTVLDFPELSCNLRLITASAQSVVADDRTAPERAAIWGAGRVAGQEHPELNCTLIDLPELFDQIDVERLAEIVRMENLPGEIALRGADIHTRRLNPLDLGRCEAKSVPLTPSINASYRLTQSTPGSIEDLRFEMKPATRPGPDEVVIRVRAAGLNFRDVLTALGKLPVPSRRPPSFGWECVGEVIARGDGK